MELDQIRDYARECADHSNLHYKSAAWLDNNYKIYLLLSIIFSIIALIYEQLQLTKSIALICGAVGIILTIWILINQRMYQNVELLQDFGCRYEILYDKLKSFYYYHGPNEELIFNNIKEELFKLRSEATKIPKPWIGILLSKIFKNKKFDLRWMR